MPNDQTTIAPIDPDERWFVVEHVGGGITIQDREGGAGRLIVADIPGSKAHPSTKLYKSARALAEFIASAPDMQRAIEGLRARVKELELELETVQDAPR